MNTPISIPQNTGNHLKYTDWKHYTLDEQLFNWCYGGNTSTDHTSYQDQSLTLKLPTPSIYASKTYVLPQVEWYLDTVRVQNAERRRSALRARSTNIVYFLALKGLKLIQTDVSENITLEETMYHFAGTLTSRQLE